MFCFSFLPSRMRYSPRDGRCPQKNETYFWRGFGPNRNERNGEIISGWNEKERRNSVAIDVWPGTDTTVHDFHSATTRALRDKVGTIIEFLDERSSRLSLCSLLSSPVGRNGNKRKSCIYLFPYVCVFLFLLLNKRREGKMMNPSKVVPKKTLSCVAVASKRDKNEPPPISVEERRLGFSDDFASAFGHWTSPRIARGAAFVWHIHISRSNSSWACMITTWNGFLKTNLWNRIQERMKGIKKKEKQLGNFSWPSDVIWTVGKCIYRGYHITRWIYISPF